MTRPLIIAAAAAVLALGLTATLDVEAKRLGGGRSAGMQRQATTAPAHTPAQPAGTQGTAAPAAATAPNAAAAPVAAAAAAAPKRSWMGPVAGLAAGLGLAALASHFGFGEALANFMTIALLGVALLAIIGFVMRKRAANQPALAGAGGPTLRTNDAGAGGGSLIGSRVGGMSSMPATTSALPADFDAQGFARIARDQFMALQAANDAGDLQRLRAYLTPEMFDVVSEEIAARQGAQQATQVFGLEAQVLAVAQEADRYVVSVRFTGRVREQSGAVPEDLDEVWHLTKPVSGMGGWVIAGIQQTAAGH